MEFVPFPKIPRLFRDIVVTEKIDGTNASVHVLDDGRVLAASRNRYITPENDNYGFARWVAEHEDELRSGLGVGSHFGEWWGQGIQRGYGLMEKRFSLFNVAKWRDWDVRPKCCDVVPVLYEGPFNIEALDRCLDELAYCGSVAAFGYMKPEGVVVYHGASNALFKVTLENDGSPKGRVAA